MQVLQRGWLIEEERVVLQGIEVMGALERGYYHPEKGKRAGRGAGAKIWE